MPKIKTNRAAANLFKAIAYFHISDSGIEAFDHLTGTADKLKGFATIVGRIKLCSVIKGSFVMSAAGFADIASCDFRHDKILQKILICGNGKIRLKRPFSGKFVCICYQYTKKCRNIKALFQNLLWRRIPGRGHAADHRCIGAESHALLGDADGVHP